MANSPETKRFVELLCEEIKKNREQIDGHIGHLRKYPEEAAALSYEIGTVKIKLYWRTMLFKYLTGSMTYDELERKVYQSIRDIAADYRKEVQNSKRSAARFPIIEFSIDYILKAASSSDSNWNFDLILENAGKYPRLDSVLDVFEIDQPTTFGDANTTEVEVE